MGQGHSTKGTDTRVPSSSKVTKSDHSSGNPSSRITEGSSTGKNSPRPQSSDPPQSSSTANSSTSGGAQSPSTSGHTSTARTNPIQSPPETTKHPSSLSRQPSSGSTGNGGGAAMSKTSQIEKFFLKYKDSDEDAVLASGMEKFCVDLGVDPTEFIVLVLAWKFGASQMCRFTREEFINGCQKMRAHDARSLKERFPELLAEAKSEKNFKDLYNFTFTFGLDYSSGQRTLPIELALPLWDLVFTQNRPAILDQWFNFLKASDVKGVSRDTWSMFLPFINTVAPDLHNYDESEAWPSLFDDFVEFHNSQQGSRS